MNVYSYKNEEMYIYDIPVKKLISDYGSPLRITAPHIIQQNYSHIFSIANDKSGGVFECGYAIKANQSFQIVSEAAVQTDFLEVSSYFDLEILERCYQYIGNKKIICNGFKTPGSKYFEKIISLHQRGFNIVFVVDNLSEVKGLQKISAPLSIGVRIAAHGSLNNETIRDRFGLSLPELEICLQKISKSSHSIHLVHMHVQNTMTDHSVRLSEFADLVSAAHIIQAAGYDIEFIDFGGGLPQPNENNRSLYDKYFRGLEELALQITNKTGMSPKILLECGRALVANTQTLILTVIASKPLFQDCACYILNGSAINLLPELALDQELSFQLLSGTNQSENQPVICAGNTCDPEDYFNRVPVNLPLFRTNSSIEVVIPYTGAYQQSLRGAGSNLPGHCLIEPPLEIILRPDGTLTEQTTINDPFKALNYR